MKNRHELPEWSDLRALLVAGLPMIDVRSPVEFATGAVPGAINHPILNDFERERVGTEYANNGPAAAERLGHELVSGETREQRVEQWSRFAEDNPDGGLYCFRGGLRSQIAQAWLNERGVCMPRVSGGYKAMRRYLIDAIDELVQSMNLQVLGGRTGVTKTRLISTLPNAIDLEGLANHRGSSFGGWPTPTTRPQYFENDIGLALLRLSNRAVSTLVVEDEGTNIGGVPIPVAMVEKMATAPLVILEASLDERVTETVRGYISESLQAHRLVDPGSGFDNFSRQLEDSLFRIKKRLGGVVYEQIRGQLDSAIAQHRESGDIAAHRDWIRLLLSNYYDPMYDYQLAQKTDRIVFRGDKTAVQQWFESHLQSTTPVDHTEAK